MSREIVGIDLFAGAGGLGLAAIDAGVDLRLSVDNDALSCRTMEANEAQWPGDVWETDILQVTGDDLRGRARVADDDFLLVVGGAPCQPFSKAAYWTDEGKEAAFRRSRANGISKRRPAPPAFVRPDARRTLVQEFMRLVLEADADAFVFENVRSITHPRHRPVLDGLLETAAECGYGTRVVFATAAEYGVPQLRQRVFVLASRTHEPKAPSPTHLDPRKPGDEDLPFFPAVGPVLEPFAGAEWAEEGEVVQGRWADHLREVPPGGNYKAHTAWAGHPNPSFETETRYWNFLLKLDPDRPSWTINASPGPWTGPFHWDSRRLRIPELAAIQGFPVGYEFVGSRREQVRQIGNAVPPALGAPMIAQAVEVELGESAGRELERV